MKKKAAKGRNFAKSTAAAKRRVLKNASMKKTAISNKKARKPAESKAPKFSTVADYLAHVPEPARSALNQMRAAIREVVPPEATEVISYNIPAFKHKKILVWYAAFAHHCSLFPTGAVIEAMKDDLKDYIAAKGTVQFPLDKPMPLELIKKLTQARVERE
jgi:uncharacterized protein YdhG (YjbR/CyaY superfamily)